MRSVTLALVLLLSVSAFAGNTKLSELLQTSSTAQDAADTAIQVLYDLRQANYDAIDTADERNRTEQAACDAEIADLLSIADANKEAGDASTAHRKYLEKEVEDTHAYLEWINQRRIDIAARQVELQDQRCYSAGIFVRALKEHSDALEAIQLLRQDLLPAAETQDSAELVQVKDATSKLAAYRHLFNEQALSAFNQLADAVDPETAEWDSRADDNDKEAIKLAVAAHQNADRGDITSGADLTEQIGRLLDHLEEHLNNGIADLEHAEVKAGWDLAVWLQDSEAEVNHLNGEEVQKNTYLDKTLISLQAARAQENKAWEIYFQSASNYHNAIVICVRKGVDYEANKHQLQDEGALIDDVIKTFKENVTKFKSL